MKVVEENKELEIAVERKEPETVLKEETKSINIDSAKPYVTSQGKSYTVTLVTAEHDLLNNLPDMAAKVTFQEFDDWTNLATFHKIWQYFEARPKLSHLTLNWSNKGIANNPHMRAGEGEDNIFRKADRTARLSLPHIKHLDIDLSDNDITTIRALTHQLWDMPNLGGLNLKLRVTAGGLDQTSIDDLISTLVEVPGVGGNVDGKHFPNLERLVIDLTGNVIQLSTDQRKKLRHWYPGVKIVVNDPGAPANLCELPQDDLSIL
jgi:hypothetical protein